MTRNERVNLDLVDSRSEALLTLTYGAEEVSASEREQVRAEVGRMSQVWALKNQRTRQRRRFNERLVMAMLGVADAEEEADVLWRMWLRPQQGWYR